MKMRAFYRQDIFINHIMLYREMHSNEHHFLMSVSIFHPAGIVFPSQIKRDKYVHEIIFEFKKNAINAIL
jgi:cytochrome b